MAQIFVSGMTFCYEGSYDNIFEQVSFSIDTDWKLGLIGRNGKGKTTFLNLLLGKYEYTGSISTPVTFGYFPYQVKEEWKMWDTIEVLDCMQPDYELWKVCRELDLLKTDAGILYRPFETLSHGERTKVMLALLFTHESSFLLIDEPTNHLDVPTRDIVRDYLNQKKGFILVSHDRWILDACVDHVLVLERNQIQVEKGNFTSWWDNKQKQDSFERSENQKLKKEIRKLEKSAKRTADWANKVEGTKIGFDPKEEHDRSMGTRSYIGEKSRRMQQRRKNLERRQDYAMEEKSGLLKNLEQPVDLRLMPLNHHKDVYVLAQDLNLRYQVSSHTWDKMAESKSVVDGFWMELKRGERIVLQGRNGSGKSSIIKQILHSPQIEILGGYKAGEIYDAMQMGGNLEIASGLKISYISQDTSWLVGKLDDHIQQMGVSNSLFKAILRQLDFERVQFEKTMEEYSEGQKKKVLIAGSLLQQAHLYIWDEPLNYIDVFSRMQIEQLILKFKPAMLMVEHDRSFSERCATRIISLGD